METETGLENPIEQAFHNHIDDLDTAPAWWKEFKRQSFEAYTNSPMPSRRDEPWRFSSRSRFQSIESYSFDNSDSAKIPQGYREWSSITSSETASLTFVDDRLVESSPLPANLIKTGVLWLPLAEAIQSHRDLLKDYFMKQPADLGSEKFAHLHAAFVKSGALLYIPKGVEIESPFTVFNWNSHSNGTIFPHTLVITEENSKASLVEFHGSIGENQALSCGVTHLFAGVGSKLDYTLVQNFNEQTLGCQINSNVASRDSQINMHSVILGCQQYRSETHGQVKGAGAHIDICSMALTETNQEIDQRTLQTHAAPKATSNLLFKNALMGESKTIFSGLIKVDETAQQTDAYQTNRNLLLNRSAEANSLPGLEIEANDVKCSHGATTSEIDEEAIFYMLARGIPKQVAQELLVYGFFEEVLNRIADDTLAESARQMIRCKFHH